MGVTDDESEKSFTIRLHKVKDDNKSGIKAFQVLYKFYVQVKETNSIVVTTLIYLPIQSNYFCNYLYNFKSNMIAHAAVLIEF